MVNGAVSIRLIYYYAWQVAKTTQRLSSKLARGLEQRGGWGGRSPPSHLQTQCSHGWLHRKTHMLSCKLAQVGGWGGAGPSISKHTARMVNGASKKRLILRMAGFKKRLKGCQASLHTAQNSGGVGGGGGRSPPFANTMLAWLAS